MIRSPYVAEDLYRSEQVRDLDVRPDGTEVAYEVQTIDRVNDTYVSGIYVVPTRGGEAIELVHPTANNGMPRWSPDGEKLAFLSDRAGTMALFVLPRAGGEPRMVAQLANPIGAYEWSPDGTQLVASVPLQLDPDRKDHAPQVITKQRYKSDGMGFLLASVGSIVTIDVGTGKTTQVTETDRDAMTPCWCPAGKRIAFIQARMGTHDGHLSDLWIIDAPGAGARQLTSEVISAAGPAWSPDGKYIAFTGNTVPGEALQFLWIVDVASGTVRKLGEDLEVASFPSVRPSPPCWSADSKRVITMAYRRGRAVVAAIGIDGGHIDWLEESDAQVMVLRAAGDTLAVVQSPATRGAQVKLVGQPRVLAQAETWRDERDELQLEAISVPTPHGPIEGWLFYRRGRPTPGPLLVYAHGGPQSIVSYGNGQHHYWSLLASKGWTIMGLNASGSASYGVDFARALIGKWGELCLPEHLAGIDELQKRGLADDRLAIAGKSYGGYLSARAIGVTPRFKAAVVSAPVVNVDSHFGTSDSGHYVDPYDLGGELWEREDLVRKLSPVFLAHRSTTPTLILQGEDDQRCPRGQSEELFARLMRAGKTTAELVLYPGGSHSLEDSGRPSHRCDYHRRIADWCERYATAPA